jgi:hypothetical protein
MGEQSHVQGCVAKGVVAKKQMNTHHWDTEIG